MSHHLEQLLDPQRRADCARHDEAMRHPKFAVIDRHTGRSVACYLNQARARSQRDKLDLEYGAIRYAVREVLA